MNATVPSKQTAYRANIKIQSKKLPTCMNEQKFQSEKLQSRRGTD